MERPNRIKPMAIEKWRILRNTTTKFAVYALNPKYPLCPPGTDYLLITSAGSVWQSAEMRKLHEAEACYIDEADKAAWELYLKETTLIQKDITPQMQVKKVEDVAVHLIQSTKNTKIDDAILSEFHNVATGVVDVLKQSKDAVKHIQTLVSHSEYTYYHSVGVSLLCSSIGRELGEKNEDVQRDLALGGLLHDIGKVSIPDKVLSSPQQLSPADWEIMRKHPELGIEKLKDVAGVSERVRNMISFHHEKTNGRGYPAGVAGDKIPVEARICAVADIYSALTTTRAYRPKRNAFEALMLMRHNMKDEIWPPALDALVKILANELKK